MLAALFLMLVQVEARCVSCTTTSKDVRLCAPHAEEEHALFARAGKRLSSKEDKERMAALDELARSTFAHVNAPSKRVADRLVAALDDESFEVRTYAAERLGRPQNALVALAGLLEAFDATEAERAKLDKEITRLRERQVGPPRAREKQLAELKRDEAAAGRRREDLLTWRGALLAQLAFFPDDRVVEAILQAPRGLTLGGNEALVRLGSRSALQGVVESFATWEKELARFDEIEALIAEYEKADKLLADALRAVFQEDLDAKRAEMESHEPEIRRLVEERGLGPAPPKSDHPGEPWRLWLGEHAEALPETLPGVSSPAW